MSLHAYACRLQRYSECTCAQHGLQVTSMAEVELTLNRNPRFDSRVLSKQRLTLDVEKQAVGFYLKDLLYRARELCAYIVISARGPYGARHQFDHPNSITSLRSPS